MEIMERLNHALTNGLSKEEFFRLVESELKGKRLLKSTNSTITLSSRTSNTPTEYHELLNKLNEQEAQFKLFHEEEKKRHQKYEDMMHQQAKLFQRLLEENKSHTAESFQNLRAGLQEVKDMLHNTAQMEKSFFREELGSAQSDMFNKLVKVQDVSKNKVCAESKAVQLMLQEFKDFVHSGFSQINKNVLAVKSHVTRLSSQIPLDVSHVPHEPDTSKETFVQNVPDAEVEPDKNQPMTFLLAVDNLFYQFFCLIFLILPCPRIQPLNLKVGWPFLIVGLVLGFCIHCVCNSFWPSEENTVYVERKNGWLGLF
ncbi:uncharacterized protein LOC131937536 [Physella acuta]|uniref:uncharacterized protein LOC131937536 n=1 Tax=Physella acuta TaxID=109671 RepID=UPI0027DB7087|nr:uncharacterized protein LOC131937536 [Physella acuta]XP_059151040.1 uncharacterized protein LOC131937536 [Physella acuta]